MMDAGPESKRPRLSNSPWPPSSSQEPSRQLPPPPRPDTSYQSQHLPNYPRPEPPSHILGGRPQEHPQYDHPRPNSGSSHPYPPSHPPPPLSQQPYARSVPEPVVKRDPSDEPQYRPNSTGNGPDHHVNHPPPHEANRPYIPQYDPTRPTYQQQYPPTPSPMSATESPYNNGPYGQPLPPPREAGQQYSVSYPQTRPQPDIRKKAQRAAQACDSCRSLKAKCDEGRPSCTSCKEKNMECRYRDPPPKQQDKASADLMELLGQVQSLLTTSMNAIYQRFDSLENQIKSMQQAAAQNSDYAGPMKMESDDGTRMPQSRFSRPSVDTDSQNVPPSESPYASTPGVQKAPEIPQTTRVGEEVSEEEDSGDPGPPKEPSIPVNHTTGAARLLLYEPIAELVGKTLMKSAKKQYPIIQEERRGLLRLYGRGEGYDTIPGATTAPEHDDSTPGDTPSSVSSPAGVEEYGVVRNITPNPTAPYQASDFKGNSYTEGLPDFSRDVVYDLVRSYNTHINIMHPILLPSQLNQLVEHFLATVESRGSQIKPRHSTVAGFAQNSSHKYPESPATKRKRSPFPGEHTELPTNNVQEHRPGHPVRTIASAIVMLVLALGKICQYRGHVMEAASSEAAEASYKQSPVASNGHPPSPTQSSPSLSTLTGISSPQDNADRMYSRSRRTSVEGGGSFAPRSGFKPKNMDVIPGLAYFALATDVLGNQIAGNSLSHVHANILAGLYHGQLGRVMESHGYIAAACRSLQVQLRPKLEKFKRIKAAQLAGDTSSSVPTTIQGKDNSLVFAFWTCLQLESDIVAELPCPHSGILTYEEDIPNPNYHHAVETDGFDGKMIESYATQLFLRRHLNSLHNMFYKPESEDKRSEDNDDNMRFRTIDACEQNLEAIGVIAPKFRWDQNTGQPGRDILEARLRAKYYGAQVITYRTFVLNILQSSADVQKQVTTNDFKANISAPRVSKKETRLEDFDPKVLDYTRKGIRALVFSTKAFHGLGDPSSKRLIVTNVWGTAHAQWGNMLTLSAVYMHPLLSQLLLEIVSKEELSELVEKTLGFLRLHSTPTSALVTDIKILEHVGHQIGLLTHESVPTTSSFSSSHSGDVSMSGLYVH